MSSIHTYFNKQIWDAAKSAQASQHANASINKSRYVRVNVDGVYMGQFCIVPDHVLQIGLEYSLRRIWDDKLVLQRVEGMEHYYGTVENK